MMWAEGWTSMSVKSTVPPDNTPPPKCARARGVNLLRVRRSSQQGPPEDKLRGVEELSRGDDSLWMSRVM